MKMIHTTPKQRTLGSMIKMKNASSSSVRMKITTSSNCPSLVDEDHCKDERYTRQPLGALTAMQITRKPLEHNISSYFCRMDKEFMQPIRCFADDGLHEILNHCSNMNNFVLNPMIKCKMHGHKIKWPHNINTERWALEDIMPTVIGILLINWIQIQIQKKQSFAAELTFIWNHNTKRIFYISPMITPMPF